jgi:hypothetical protein
MYKLKDMRNGIFIILLLIAGSLQAQVKKAGPKPAPKRNVKAPVGTSLPVKTEAPVTSQKPVTVVPNVNESIPAGFLGRYELYAGIPSTYLGHFILLADGRYQVAFASNENDYETGLYRYHADTQSVEWISGMFYNNAWKGTITSRGNNNTRLDFNKAAYAERSQQN